MIYPFRCEPCNLDLERVRPVKQAPLWVRCPKCKRRAYRNFGAYRPGIKRGFEAFASHAMGCCGSHDRVQGAIYDRPEGPARRIIRSKKEYDNTLGTPNAMAPNGYRKV